MQYLCQLGNGKMLVEVDGNLHVENTGYPYQDCEYNGIKGQMNILESFGVVIGNCTDFTEDVKKLLDNNVSTVDDLVSGIRQLSYDKYGSDYDCLIQKVIDYTKSNASLDAVKELFISYNARPVKFKEYNGAGYTGSKYSYGALLKFEKNYISSKFFKDLIALLDYKEPCLNVSDAGYSYVSDDFDLNAYIYFNAVTYFGDVLVSEQDTPVNAPSIDGYEKDDEDRAFEALGTESEEDKDRAGYCIDLVCHKYCFDRYDSEQLVSIDDYVNYIKGSLSSGELYKNYKSEFADESELIEYLDDNYSNDVCGICYKYYVSDVVNSDEE